MVAVLRSVPGLALLLGSSFFLVQPASAAPVAIAEVLRESAPAPYCNAAPEDLSQDQRARYTVEGSVIAHSGSFEKSYGNPGFQLSDATGGVFVLTDRNLDLEEGDRARVTGWPCIQFGTRALGQAEVIPLDDDDDAVGAFSPRQIGQFETRPAIPGEPDVVNNWCNCNTPVSATEGRLITVRGTAVADLEQDGAFGYKLYLDDGRGVGQIFIDALSGIPAEELAEEMLRQGRDLCVTGVVARFSGVGFELLPRDEDDFVEARPDRDDPCED